ncbi:MAG: hydrogenase maturation protease [Leptolyngbya sp. SIOISBB]|nr:hydrogenase maturation protease [Leptolyngbya sp. SIOISBB]
MQTLVIGYGNTLRGDDGVGYLAAEQVADWNLLDVTAIACHQLTPELAAALTECDRVIFIDATLPGTETAVQVRSLQPATVASLDAHRSDPAELLQLTAQLYGSSPPAFHLLLPTAEMGFTEDLSAIAQTGLEAALQKVRALLKGEGA